MNPRRMKMRKSVTVCRFPNESIREYNVRVEISQSPRESFQRPLRDSSETYLTAVGEVGADLVRRLMAVPGVTEVAIYPYTVRITKAPSFSWEETEALVKKELYRLYE
ncbi:MAG: NifU N-terminal domain-containing protein [Patescibacteria group bacterium]|nr:NifU N-terminal domain-containing protein [Patescibacteria group bacterium]